MFDPRREISRAGYRSLAHFRVHRAVNVSFLMMVNKIQTNAPKLQPAFFTSLKVGMPENEKARKAWAFRASFDGPPYVIRSSL
ncbi:hypothetical protein RGR602_CH02535 [Rhizobium gallicum bv. gallicum R602sp]|uniref:Uncharacterized protein n=1 Tax=Rhizobium gallicum bv. gallicum R602sp TaxID=1041138 RepID=A0A0B4X1P0_9HYPH|nr:hypothetical protein RGR602_CH02535 [Rhizobium gallicum bv. gallicum R602sp]